ncbi:MAG: MBL fold metallo-hydrolase [Terriglobales bacterium]
MRTLLLSLVLALAAGAQTQAIMLGSGTPNAEPDRSGPAAAVVVNGAAYLVDAGPGVVRRAKAAALAGHPALRLPNISHVFFTHLHSDHTLGYPDLIFTPWVLGRRAPLEAYGPPGLAAMTAAIERAWTQDIAIRTDGLEHANRTGYKVNVHEILPGVIYHDANVTITAFAVHHGSWPHAYGYRFQTADRVIVFSGDTSPVAAVAKACNGCDLLFHEAYNPQGRITPAWRTYMQSFHTSATELAAIARAAHPKLLVIDHIMFEGRPPAELLAEVQAGYKGRVVMAQDLAVY